MNKIVTWILLFFIIGTGCAKDDISDKICNETGIQGEWLWIKTEGGVSGALITPENAGYNKTLVIDDVVWREYLNDSLIKESQYIFVIDSNSIFSKGWIEFDNLSGLFATVVNCNLRLTCGFDDCFVSLYEKKE